MPPRSIFSVVALAGAVLFDPSLSAQSPTRVAAQSTNQTSVLERAVADFERGRIEESVDGFDALVRMRPDAMPQLWQRGIALYYAGRYAECREQFEAHRKVNPADVENAAWHFLCVARAESPARAQAALLPVGRDRRVPMAQIYRMFEGVMAPDAVLAAGGADRGAQFYARLYVGLYFEATGDARRAFEHLTVAADKRFASVGGYMHTVAKVHVSKLPKAPAR
jgi:lipoprotein NlpI